MKQEEVAELLSSLRDVSDFCVHWNHFRPFIADKTVPADDLQRDILDRLIGLADKVCVGLDETDSIER